MSGRYFLALLLSAATGFFAGLTTEVVEDIYNGHKIPGEGSYFIPCGKKDCKICERYRKKGYLERPKDYDKH